MASVYVPLSPARSENAYVPLSPAHSVGGYEPLSPATSVVNFDVSKASILQKILYNIQNRPIGHNHSLGINYYVKGCPKCDLDKSSRPVKEIPKIKDWRRYCWHLMYNEKKKYKEVLREYRNACDEIAKNFAKKNKKNVFDIWLGRKENNKEFIQISKNKLLSLKSELTKYKRILLETQHTCVEIFHREIVSRERKNVLRTLIKEWRESCPTPIRKPREPINVPKDPYRMIFKYEVQEDGHIKVNLSAPLAPIYDKYFSKGIKPPFEEYIVALRDFGYPDWVIEKMIKRHDPENYSTISVHEALEIFKVKKTKVKKTSILNKFKR